MSVASLKNAWYNIFEKIKGREILEQGVKRKSAIELLRIIAMILIVAHHFSLHGDFGFSAETVSLNRVWIQFMQFGGKIGVNIFVLISGYFLITAEKLKTQKILKFILQVLTYSVLIFGCFVVFGSESLGVKSAIRSLFPLIHSTWWFASAYFVLYLLSPYLNRLLNSLDKKNYLRLLALLTLIWSIVPTIFEVSMQSNYLLWFIYLYALAGFIRLHASLYQNAGKYFAVAVITVLVTNVIVVALDFLGTRFSFFDGVATYLYHMQRIPVLLCSVALFIAFLGIDIGYKPIINIISSATFGVYLIHDNKYIRPFLWQTLFKNASFRDSRLLILYSVFVVFLVFALCTCIELARKYLLEKLYLKKLDGISEKIDKFLDKVFNSSPF